MRWAWLLVALLMLVQTATAQARGAPATSAGRLTIAFPDERQPAPGPASNPSMARRR